MPEGQHNAPAFTDAEAVAIRNRYARGGLTQHDLAAEYGVARSTISNVLLGTSYSHIPSQQPDWPVTHRILDPMTWKDAAACKDAETSLFFPTTGQVAKEAKELCAVCAVQPECLAFALDHPDEQGVWGGTSEKDRSRIRGKKRRSNRNHLCKLNAEQVLEIRRLLKTKTFTQRAIAARFGVSEYTISGIARGRSWVDVQLHEDLEATA